MIDEWKKREMEMRINQEDEKPGRPAQQSMCSTFIVAKSCIEETSAFSLSVVFCHMRACKLSPLN